MRLGCIGKCEFASDGWSCRVISTPLDWLQSVFSGYQNNPALWRRPSETPSPYWTGISPRGAQRLQRCGCSQDREWRNRRDFSQCPWRYWQDSGVQWPDFRAVDQDGCSKHGALLSPSYKANVRRAKEKLTDLGEKRLSQFLTHGSTRIAMVNKKFHDRKMLISLQVWKEMHEFWECKVCRLFSILWYAWALNCTDCSFTRHCVQKLKTNQFSGEKRRLANHVNWSLCI